MAQRAVRLVMVFLVFWAWTWTWRWLVARHSDRGSGICKVNKEGDTKFITGCYGSSADLEGSCANCNAMTSQRCLILELELG